MEPFSALCPRVNNLKNRIWLNPVAILKTVLMQKALKNITIMIFTQFSISRLQEQYMCVIVCIYLANLSIQQADWLCLLLFSPSVWLPYSFLFLYARTST